MCDIDELIRGRRSIRKFKDDDVPDKLVLEVLDAARWAPSAGNLQPWRFIVVRNRDTKLRLCSAALDQMFIAEAPVVIVVCSDLEIEANWYGERGVKIYSIIDAGLAIQNLVLKAYSLGLGTCIVGAFSEREVSKILSIPRYVKPLAIIPLGYPAEKPIPPSRKSLEELTRFERWS